MSRHRQAIEIFEDATGDIALGELDAAIAKYQYCVRLDPEYFDAWHALGMALMKADRFPEAIDALIECFDAKFDGKGDWKRAYTPEMFRERIAKSLTRLTGQNFPADKKQWETWWQANRASFKK